MDFTGLLIIGGLLSYAGVMVYIANQVDAERHLQTAPAYTPPRAVPGAPVRPNWFASPALLRWLLYGLAGMMFILGLTVLQTALFSDLSVELQQPLPAEELPEVDMAGGALTFVAAAAAALISYRLAASDSTRQWFQQRLNRWGGQYNPESQVHMVAFILMLAVAVWTLANFVLQGGVEGIAQDIQENGLEASDVIFQAVIEVVITLLGVGFAIRRGLPETLERLGLRWPTRQDVVWGLGVGVALLIIMMVFNAVWSTLISPEVMEEQTAAADALSQAFATLPLAFVLATSAALGEEIWIRGGLQPIFGIGATSIFFATLHMQVAFTPAILLILLVSLAWGWLRQRQSTTAAILAHFCFDFVQLALLTLLTEVV